MFNTRRADPTYRERSLRETARRLGMTYEEMGNAPMIEIAKKCTEMGVTPGLRLEVDNAPAV
jgi:uncharacterized protein YunC (DUF1805 family)